MAHDIRKRLCLTVLQRSRRSPTTIWGLCSNRCPLLALSGHRQRPGECPLSGVKRTSLTQVQMSASDPKRTLSRLNQISPASTNDCLVTSICSGLRCSSASRNAVKGMRDSSLENGTASWDRPNRQVLCARMPPSLGWPSRSGMMGCSLGLLSGVVLGCSQDM